MQGLATESGVTTSKSIPDSEAWDDTSIASSRHISPALLMDEPNSGYDHKIVLAEEAVLRMRDRDVGNLLVEELQSQGESLQEQESVPGLLSSGVPSLNSPLVNTSARNESTPRVNCAAFLTSKRDNIPSDSRPDTSDRIVNNTMSSPCLELAASGPDIAGKHDATFTNLLHNSPCASSKYVHRCLDSAGAPVDPGHVRPSLNMTAQEFSETKRIILDLLGWGVPSEYFVRCGLARESIYYAFTELNLRLPSNLDIDGIVPYEPPPNLLTPPSHMGGASWT